MRRAVLVVGLVALAAVPSVAAARDHRVVRGRHITALYALNGTVLYGTRSRGSRTRWMRIVNGKRSPARRLDGGLFAPISIGADSSGHVVAVSLGRDSRWRAYDIARDRSRRVAVPTRRDCTIRQVAIWRQRTAIVRYCGGTEGEALLRVGHRTRVLARGGTIDADFLAIAGRSIVSGTYSDQGSGLRLLLDRGRRCPNDQVVLEPVDHAWHGLPGVWIGAHGLEWVMGAETALYSGRFADLAVMAVHLTGRCSAIATRWHVPTRRFRTVTAVAIDGHELYYATDEGIFRRRLTSRESDAPPANDSIEHATRLTGPLPVRVAGVVGHATLQGGEPVQSGVGRTVWYSWRPSTSERVTVNVAGPQYQWTGMFTGGPGLSTLAPVPPVDQCLANVFDVAARQTYWIATGTWGAEPSYAPFTLAITRRLPAPC